MLQKFFLNNRTARVGTHKRYLIDTVLCGYVSKGLNENSGSDTATGTVMTVQAEPQYFAKARRAGRIIVDGQ